MHSINIVTPVVSSVLLSPAKCALLAVGIRSGDTTIFDSRWMHITYVSMPIILHARLIHVCLSAQIQLHFLSLACKCVLFCYCRYNATVALQLPLEKVIATGIFIYKFMYGML